MTKKCKFILGFALGFVLFLIVHSPVVLFNSVRLDRGHFYELWAGSWFELKLFLLSSASIILGAAGGLVLWTANLFIRIIKYGAWAWDDFWIYVIIPLSLGLMLPSAVRYFKYNRCRFIDTALIAFGYAIWCYTGYDSMRQFLWSLLS